MGFATERSSARDVEGGGWVRVVYTCSIEYVLVSRGGGGGGGGGGENSVAKE